MAKVKSLDLRTSYVCFFCYNFCPSNISVEVFQRTGDGSNLNYGFLISSFFGLLCYSKTAYMIISFWKIIALCVRNVPPLSQKKGMHRLMSIVFKGVFTCAFKCILPKLCRFEKGKLNHMWHLVTCVCMMLIVLLPIFLLMSFTKQNNELTPALDSGFFGCGVCT